LWVGRLLRGRAVASHGGIRVERIPDWAEFTKEIKEFFGADCVAEVLDKERSG
jgi:hypothetical protein